MARVSIVDFELFTKIKQEAKQGYSPHFSALYHDIDDVSVIMEIRASNSYEDFCSKLSVLK